MLQRGQGHARLTSRGLDNAGSHRRRDLTMFEFFSKICPRPQRAPNFCYGHRDHRGEAGHIDGLDPFDKTLVISTFQIASKWQILRFSVVLNLEGEAKLSPISVSGTDHRLFIVTHRDLMVSRTSYLNRLLSLSENSKVRHGFQ